MNTSDVIISYLEKVGVEYIFALPGEENLDLIEAIRKSEIELIITKHESAAGFMASTYGRLTGKLGVCVTTLGPGATNAMTSIAYAYLCGCPTLFLTGEKPIQDNEQGHFQKVDFCKMVEASVKATTSLKSANDILFTLDNLVGKALEHKQGPVHIELPEDIARAQVDEKILKDFKVKTHIRSDRASDKTIDGIEHKIKTAEKPIVVFGSRANKRENKKANENFIKKTGLYFLTSQMGKGAVDERDSKYLGCASLSEDDYLHEVVEGADLIISVGLDTSEKPPFLNKKNIDCIHIDECVPEHHISYRPSFELIGNIKFHLNDIASILENYRLEEICSAELERVSAKIFEKDLSTIPDKSIEKIVSIVRDTLPEDSLISLDNGLYKVWFSRNYKAYNTESILLDNALATMGAGLPNAVVAKKIFPNKKVIAVCGDGGFLMNCQELITAKALELDLTIIVLVDDSYGMIKWKQNKSNLEKFAMDFEGPDYEILARAYGADFYEASKDGDLADSLSKSISRSGISLIKVPFSYYLEHSTLPDRLEADYEINESLH